MAHSGAHSAKYAPYWEDDNTMNPVIVRFIERVGDFFTVELPNNAGTRQVHLHTLGKFRAAL
jgi:hypothetical protein